MYRFNLELEYKLVELQNVANVVRYSSIVQTSLSCLNLELSKYCLRKNRILTYSYYDHKPSTIFINTDESCRKSMTRGRDLYYNLNLDVPKQMECSLKNNPSSLTLSASDQTFHLGKIAVLRILYSQILTEFVNYFFRGNFTNSKIFPWLLQFYKITEVMNWELHAEIVDRFATCFYPDFTDSKFIQEFLQKYHPLNWLVTYEKPHVLKYFLHQLHYNGKRFDESLLCPLLLTDLCIFKSLFLNVGPIVKFTFVHGISSFARDLYMTEILDLRTDVSYEALYEHTKWTSIVRSYQLLQLLCIYLKRNLRVSAASEALRYIWDSTAAAFLSSKEIEKAFERVLNPGEVDDLYSFYVQAVSEIVEDGQPRSLQQYCRINVRKILLNCNRWIPDAIKQIGLPSSLQSYVKLETQAWPLIN